jgi:ubiquinone/menaquinone biosynthesis C-methylase UbiE
MGLIEIAVSFLLLLLILIILVSGMFRLKTSRKASLEGIEDPKAAEAYDRISRTPPFKLIRRGVVKKLKSYDVKGTIVDIGCGPGYLLQAVAKELSENFLVGVDISREMVEKAKANFESMGYGERVEFKQGSADHLPFEDGTQDFIISSLSLHHWDEPQAVFKEIYRVLKPGGQILIYDLRRDARMLFFYLIWFAQHIALRFIDAATIRKMNEPMGSLLASYTKQEAEEMMKRTPFEDYKVEGKLIWMYIYGKKRET